MSLRTRGSSEVDKAERRLAGLKSIDPNLDLGYGLTIAAYSELIELVRELLSLHNQKVADLDTSRKTLDAIDRKLADMSSRMLNAVKLKYGRNSTEYSKVGGTVSNNSNSDNSSIDATENTIEIDSNPQTILSSEPESVTNGNGRGKK
jgi:hypothetical protein